MSNFKKKRSFQSRSLLAPYKSIQPEIIFQKYEGCGNDFIICDFVDLPPKSLREIQQVKDIRKRASFLCDRNRGIGADGIILALSPLDTRSDARMHILNSDGSSPEMCGNGLRCLVKFLMSTRGPISKRHWTIDTPAGIISAWPQDNGLISVDMGSPRLCMEDVPCRPTTSIPDCCSQDESWKSRVMLHFPLEIDIRPVLETSSAFTSSFYPSSCCNTTTHAPTLRATTTITTTTTTSTTTTTTTPTTTTSTATTVMGTSNGLKTSSTKGLESPSSSHGAVSARTGRSLESVSFPPCHTGFSFRATAIGMGNPHVIIPTESRISLEDLRKIGPLLENHSAFPQKTNVHFLQVTKTSRSNKTNVASTVKIDDRYWAEMFGLKNVKKVLQTMSTRKFSTAFYELNVQTWERGAGLTQACGTGACASFVAACLLGLCPRETIETKTEIQVSSIQNSSDGTMGTAVHVLGGTLFIRWTEADKLLMTGPANFVFKGILP